MDNIDQNNMMLQDELASFARNSDNDSLKEAFENCKGNGSFSSPIIFDDNFYRRDANGQRTLAQAWSMIESYSRIYKTCVFWRRSATSELINATVVSPSGKVVTVTIMNADLISGKITAIANDLMITPGFRSDFEGALFNILEILNSQALGFTDMECNSDERSGNTLYSAWFQKES